MSRVDLARYHVGDTLLHALHAPSPGLANIVFQSAVGGTVAAVIAVFRGNSPRLT